MRMVNETMAKHLAHGRTRGKGIAARRGGAGATENGAVTVEIPGDGGPDLAGVSRGRDTGDGWRRGPGPHQADSARRARW